MKNKFRKQANSFMRRVQSSYKATISPIDKHLLECELANLLKNAYNLGQRQVKDIKNE